MLILSLLAVSPLVVKLILELVEKNNLTTLRNKRKYDKLFLIICGILITFVMGFRGRYTGSPDTDNYWGGLIGASKYKNFFDYFSLHVTNNNYLLSEIGFYFCNWLLARIYAEPQLLLLATSAFIVYSVMRFIYKNSENVLLSVVMFVCLGLWTFNMNGMRQALAMAICLWAYEFVKKDKFWKFLLVVFIAFLFHKTSVVFLAVYLIKFLKFDAKSVLFFLILLGVFVALSPILVQYFDEVYDKNYSEGESFESGGLFQLLLYVIILIVALIFNNAMREKDGKNFFYLTLLALFFFVMRYIGIQIFERISYYFSYFAILLLPNTVKKAQKLDGEILSFSILILSILLFIYRTNAGAFSTFYLCF